jgi:hypothetical protein
MVVIFRISKFSIEKITTPYTRHALAETSSSLDGRHCGNAALLILSLGQGPQTSNFLMAVFTLMKKGMNDDDSLC